MAQRRLFLFGTPRLETDGKVTPISRRKVMALLAYLAVTGRRHGRDALVTLLWPDEEPPRARAYFRRTLSLANRTLGGDGILADRESVGLHPDLDLWVDVAAFQQRISVLGAHGHPVSELCPDCVGPLEEAVELYADDFLAGFTLGDSAAFDEWQFFQSEALRDGAAGALALLSAWYGERAEEESDKALAYGRRWLALDPLHESAHRQLMRLYAKLGQRSAALRQYRLCVRTLEQELGVAPSAETSALYEGIRAIGPDPAGAGTPQVASTVPLPTTLPLPAFLDDTERPVIAERPVFVGREPELARLDGYLEAALAGHGQVAFITGGPGRGKTALLRAFAEQAMAVHPDLLVVSGGCNAYSGVGDAYLPFRETLGMLTGDVESRWRAGRVSREHAQRLWSALSVTLPALVAHGPYVIDSFVSGSGVVMRAGQSGLGDADWMVELRTLSDRSAGGGLEQQALFQQVMNTLQAVAVARPLLLVLDDLQWMDQGSIGLLFHLGRRLAGCRILVVGAYRPEEVAAGRPSGGTSDGASATHPLTKTLNEFRRDFGDVWIDLRQADQSEGRQFVGGLVDTEDNRLGDAFRTALYERTGGHPLFTLELMRAMQARGDLFLDAGGAWVEGESLDWTTLPARVEAVIEERLGRLTAQQRDLLAVASVEGEIFTVEILAQVEDLTMRSVLRTLRRELASRHRLVREVEAVSANGGSLSRFEFVHALFQEHLYQELSPAERRLLHGDIATTVEELYGEASSGVPVQLAHHYGLAENTEKAAEYAVRAGEQAREVYANDEAVRWYERGLALLDASLQAETGRAWQLTALTGLGKMGFISGKIPESEGHFREAIALAQELGYDPQELAVLYYLLGETLFWQEQYQEQVRIGEEGLALLGDDDASLGKALMKQIIAWGARLLGDGERSAKLIRETASFLGDLPYIEELRLAYGHIILLYRADKNVDAAMPWVKLLERQASRRGDLWAQLAAYNSRGALLGETGDLSGELHYQRLALTLVERIGAVPHRAPNHRDIALVLWASGDLKGAAVHSDRSLEYQRALFSGYFLTRCLWIAGGVSLCESDWQRAIGFFREAETLDEGENAGRACYLLGRAYQAAGDGTRALRHFADSMEKRAGRAGDVDPLDVDPLRFFFPLLGAMEKAFDSREAFKIWCQRYRADHDWLDVHLRQWFLARSKVRSDQDEVLVADPFDVRSSEWLWRDSFEDCTYDLAGGLEIRAANGRHLWRMNLSAPRLLRAIPPTGADLAVQATCQPALADRPAIGGLLLWKDNQDYLWLEVGRFGKRDVAFGGCLNNRDLVIGRGQLPTGAGPGWAMGEAVTLRLELTGDRIDAFCSLDGEQWYSVGHTSFAVDDTVQVGVHAIGMIDRTIYHGAYSEGTAIRFREFKIWAT